MDAVHVGAHDEVLRPDEDDPAGFALELGGRICSGLLRTLGVRRTGRGLPVILSSRLEREPGHGRRLVGTRDSVRIGLFAATGLPIIVAVTSTAVSAGQMSAANASVLVAGGAVTVLVMPLAATLLEDRGAGSSAGRDAARK